MKTVAFIIISLALILGFCIYTTAMVEKQCNEFISQLDEISDLIQENSWEAVSAELSRKFDKWQQTRKIWHTITDHSDIDLIDESLVRLISLAEAKKAEDCLAEIAVLKQRLHSVHDGDRITLSNIF